MPISESDYSYDESNEQHEPHYSGAVATSTTSNMMSKAELRKTHKPIMEKRRRAKINNCLNEIKDLILSAMKKDPERHSKLEKADILEMAVKHLKNIQKQQKDIAIRSDPTLALKYKTGYLECASEVTTFVDQIDGIDTGLKRRLTNHLNKCANGVDQPQQPFNFTSSSLLASFAAQSRFRDSNFEDSNNNPRPSMGIQLIPSCLPNGDFAFLVPKASFNSILSSSTNGGIPLDLDKKKEEQRPSAFVTVTPRSDISRPLSPPASPPMKIVKPKAVSGLEPEKIRSMKFPIHNPKKDVQGQGSQIPEPLCIITNGPERYRQAQQIVESRHQEENLYFGENLRHQQFGGSSSGIKRKAKDDGLLAVAPLMKYARVEKTEAVGSAFRSVVKQSNGQPEVFECDSTDSTLESENASCSNLVGTSSSRNDQDEHGDDKNESMWRPW